MQISDFVLAFDHLLKGPERNAWPRMFCHYPQGDTCQIADCARRMFTEELIHGCRLSVEAAVLALAVGIEHMS